MTPDGLSVPSHYRSSHHSPMETGTMAEQSPPLGKKEKRFQCQHCQRLFARLEHLQRHERIRKFHEADIHRHSDMQIR